MYLSIYMDISLSRVMVLKRNYPFIFQPQNLLPAQPDLS